MSGHADIAARMLSFLPYMDMKKAAAYLSFAQEKYPDGLAVENMITKNEVKPY